MPPRLKASAYLATQVANTVTLTTPRFIDVLLRNSTIQPSVTTAGPVSGYEVSTVSDRGSAPVRLYPPAITRFPVGQGDFAFTSA